nr:unnamed protein product [Digitaria exilis]
MASGGGGKRRKPRAKARGKGKKTKYLSLSDLMVKVEAGTPPPPSPEDEAEPAWEEAEVKEEEKDGGDGGGQQQQMEPFPLHNEAASTLFAALPAPSLSDILGASAGGDGSPSPSASPGGGDSGFLGAEEEDLARRALRGRERWVYCSSASSPTGTTSSSSPCSSSAASTGASARSLLLKLDHKKILAAWADRGSLYISGGRADSDAAPELELDAVLVEVEPSEPAAGVSPPAASFSWSAPEASPTGRAEKVRRYKEKRRNRLFAKRIRYEVRRVNAVKRPRFKVTMTSLFPLIRHY